MKTLSTILSENSLYTDAASKTAFLGDPSSIANAFLFNFLGFLGMINRSDNKKIFTHLKTDKQLRLTNINDDNNDISLVVKLMTDAKFFKNPTTPTEITRFLFKLKQGDITHVNDAIVHGWCDDLTPAFQMALASQLKVIYLEFRGTLQQRGTLGELVDRLKRIANKYPQVGGEFVKLVKVISLNAKRAPQKVIPTSAPASVVNPTPDVVPDVPAIAQPASVLPASVTLDQVKQRLTGGSDPNGPLIHKDWTWSRIESASSLAAADNSVRDYARTMGVTSEQIRAALVKFNELKREWENRPKIADFGQGPILSGEALTSSALRLAEYETNKLANVEQVTDAKNRFEAARLAWLELKKVKDVQAETAFWPTDEDYLEYLDTGNVEKLESKTNMLFYKSQDNDRRPPSGRDYTADEVENYNRFGFARQWMNASSSGDMSNLYVGSLNYYGFSKIPWMWFIQLLRTYYDDKSSGEGVSNLFLAIVNKLADKDILQYYAPAEAIVIDTLLWMQKGSANFATATRSFIQRQDFPNAFRSYLLLHPEFKSVSLASEKFEEMKLKVLDPLIVSGHRNTASASWTALFECLWSPTEFDQQVVQVLFGKLGPVYDSASGENIFSPRNFDAVMRKGINETALVSRTNLLSKIKEYFDKYNDYFSNYAYLSGGIEVRNQLGEAMEVLKSMSTGTWNAGNYSKSIPFFQELFAEFLESHVSTLPETYDGYVIISILRQLQPKNLHLSVPFDPLNRRGDVIYYKAITTGEAKWVVGGSILDAIIKKAPTVYKRIQPILDSIATAKAYDPKNDPDFAIFQNTFSSTDKKDEYMEFGRSTARSRANADCVGLPVEIYNDTMIGLLEYSSSTENRKTVMNLNTTRLEKWIEHVNIDELTKDQKLKLLRLFNTNAYLRGTHSSRLKNKDEFIRGNASPYARFVTGLLFDLIDDHTNEVNTFFEHIDDANVEWKVKQNLVGGGMLTSIVEKGEIKPFVKLDEAQLRTILTYNKIRYADIVESSGVKVRKQVREQLGSYLKRIKTAAAGADLSKGFAKLSVVECVNTPKELAKKNSDLWTKNHSGGKHGTFYVKIVKEFDVHLPSAEFDEYRKRVSSPDYKVIHPIAHDKEIRPAFHGCGGIAATMILRYGFAVIPQGAAGTVGRMLGNGIYFSTIIDKASQYVGNAGFGRSYGIRGYVFDMSNVLGPEDKQRRLDIGYESAGVGGNSATRSPEWCVRDPRKQLKIMKAYEVILVTRGEFESIQRLAEDTHVPSFSKHVLNEDLAQIAGCQTQFTFWDNKIPVPVRDVDGHIDMVFDSYRYDELPLGSLPANAHIEMMADGPSVVFTNTTVDLGIDIFSTEQFRGKDAELYRNLMMNK